MKTFTMKTSEGHEELVEILRRHFHKSSRADVYKMGIALLEIARQADVQGYKLAVADRDGEKVKREIVLS